MVWVSVSPVTDRASKRDWQLAGAETAANPGAGLLLTQGRRALDSWSNG